MSFPTTFANLAAGVEPASLLDTMFNVVGAQGIIPCTASGTNTVALTPRTNFYQPAAYANNQGVSFVAAATSTGSVTVALGGLGAVKLFMPSGLQAGSGDIVISTLVIAFFVSTLDSGNGGFQVMNATTPSVVQGISSTFKNLFIQNGGSPDTQIAVTADELMLSSQAGGTAKVVGVNATISTGSSGVNGLDTGVMAAATFYFIWIIYNGSTTSGLISLSSTAPTMPVGYTYKARVGAIRTGAASTNLTRIVQRGRNAIYSPAGASQTLNLPIMVSGGSGNPSAGPTLATVSLTAFVPSTAVSVSVVMFASGVSVTIAGSNSTMGISTSITNPPPLNLNLPAASTMGIMGTLVIEGSFNVFYAAGGANSAQSGLACYGWEDNLS